MTSPSPLSHGALPNNLGPTLLITFGAVTLPLLIGVVPLVTGLAELRRADGRRSWPQLRRWTPAYQVVQFWRMIKL